MSLKSTFFALKKMVQVVQIGERGGEVIWTSNIQKNSYFFFVKPSLRSKYGLRKQMRSCAYIGAYCMKMIFIFFSSSLAHLEPELELFEVWEINVRQIIIIVNGINSGTPKLQTALTKKKENHLHTISKMMISSCPVVHIQLQEACNPTSKYAKNS